MSASVPAGLRLLPPVSFLFQTLFERYILLATFVVSASVAHSSLPYNYCHQAYVYDWLLSVPEEVAIIEKRGLSWQFTIYLLSRYAASKCIVFDRSTHANSVSVNAVAQH